MQLVIDRAAIERRAACKLALQVLEAAISHCFGFPVSVQRLELWASPALFDEGRTPERYVTLPPRTDDVAQFAPALTAKVRKDIARIRHDEVTPAPAAPADAPPAPGPHDGASGPSPRRSRSRAPRGR